MHHTRTSLLARASASTEVVTGVELGIAVFLCSTRMDPSETKSISDHSGSGCAPVQTGQRCSGPVGAV